MLLIAAGSNTSNQTKQYTKFIFKNSKLFKNLKVLAKRGRIFDRVSWRDRSLCRLFEKAIRQTLPRHIESTMKVNSVQFQIQKYCSESSRSHIFYPLKNREFLNVQF